MKATLAKSSYYVFYDPETQKFLTSWGDQDFNLKIYKSENVLSASQYVTRRIADVTLALLLTLCHEDDEVSKEDLEFVERLKIKEIEVVHKMFTGNVK